MLAIVGQPAQAQYVPAAYQQAAPQQHGGEQYSQGNLPPPNNRNVGEPITLNTTTDIPLSYLSKRYCLEVYEMEFAEQAPAAPHFVARGRFQPCPGNKHTDDGSYIVFIDSGERIASTRLIQNDGQQNYLTRTYYRMHHLPGLLETGDPLFLYWGRDNKRRFASRMEMLHRPFCTLFYAEEELRIRCKRAG